MDTSSTYPTTIDVFWALVNRRSTPTSITGENFTIPSGTPYDYVLIEVPQTSSLALAGTPPGGAGSYTLQAGPPTASGEVQVNYKNGRLTFHSTDAGGSVSASYDGLGSAQVVERLNKLANMIIATQTAVGAQPFPPGYTDLADYLDAELNQLLAHATDPVTPGFTIEGGACFIDRHQRVTIADTGIDLTTGTYQFPATTATYWRRALFTINTAGTVLVYWSAEAATAGALDTPRRASNEYPVCYVDVQDDGGGTAGDAEDVDPADITDYRHIQNLEWDGNLQGAIVEREENPSTNLSVLGTTYYRISSSGVATEETVADQIIGLGTGDSHEVSAITAGFYNAVLIYFDSAGAILTREGTSNAVKASVVPPTINQYDELPVAMVYVQDDGTGTAGTILDISAADIYLLDGNRVIFETPTTVVPDLDILDLDDCLVHAQATPDTTVEVEPGTFSPGTRLLPVEFAGETVDFGPLGNNEKTITGTNWLAVWVCFDAIMSSVTTVDGQEAATKAVSNAANLSAHYIPLALVYVQGDGTGTAGGVEDVVDADIIDMREWLRRRAYDATYMTPHVRPANVPDDTVTVEQGWVTFDTGALYQMSADLNYDVSANMVYPLASGYFRYVLLVVSDQGVLSLIDHNGGASTAVAAPGPPLSPKHKNLALILVEDNGTGGTGTINTIYAEAIYNIRGDALSRFHEDTWFTVAAGTNYTVTHGLNRLPKSVAVFWQSTGSGGSDSASDITQVHGLQFLNCGCSVIEVNTGNLKVRTAGAVAGYYDASGILQKPTTGYYRVVVQ